MAYSLSRNTEREQPQHILTVVRLPHTKTKYTINEAVKRGTDLLIASTALLVFAPVMLLTAVAVKLSSPGPVLFEQERLTQGERVFGVLKFRTMVDNAEQETGPTWVQANDCRITPVGRFLRRTHLDELPQLLNILKGDMSFVGPRPERPVFVDQFKNQGMRNYSDRHLAKAGVTGYAQIQCPNPSIEEIHLKTEADLWYIENWSLLLDLWIVGKTFLYFVESVVSLTGKNTNNRALTENA